MFIDTASGALASRPHLDDLLALLRPGDTLIVWRLDRRGPNLAHLIATIDELGERGVGFRSLTEAIDMDTAAGRLQFGMMAALAAFERDRLRERTSPGLRRRGPAGGSGTGRRS